MTIKKYINITIKKIYKYVGKIRVDEVGINNKASISKIILALLLE